MNAAPEISWLWLNASCYGATLALLWHWRSKRLQQQQHNYLLLLLFVAVLATTAAITQRWLRTGQGPFLTLFEVLLSNLFSLGLIYALAYWRLPVVRPSIVLVTPVLLILSIWALNVSPEYVPLPPTFAHYWLWIHVIAGKFFLGTCLIGVGLSGLLLLRRFGLASTSLTEQSDTQHIETTIWRFMAVAFIFDSFMLVAGAVWAHDAWGRYWAWDPLETWAFVTWLALGIVLHARVTFALPLQLGWYLNIGVFALAFLTFFGVPFISLAPHKGVM